MDKMWEFAECRYQSSLWDMLHSDTQLWKLQNGSKVIQDPVPSWSDTFAGRSFFSFPYILLRSLQNRFSFLELSRLLARPPEAGRWKLKASDWPGPEY